MIKDVPTEEIPSLQGNEEFHVDPIIGTYYVSLNLQKEYFQDARVRKALSLAIDLHLLKMQMAAPLTLTMTTSTLTLKKLRSYWKKLAIQTAKASHRSSTQQMMQVTTRL